MTLRSVLVIVSLVIQALRLDAQDSTRNKLATLIRQRVESNQLFWAIVDDVAYSVRDSTNDVAVPPWSTMVFMSEGKIRKGVWKTVPVYLFDGQRMLVLRNALDTIMTEERFRWLDDPLVDPLMWYVNVPVSSAKLEEIEFESRPAYRISWALPPDGTASRTVFKDERILVEEVVDIPGMMRRVTRYSEFVRSVYRSKAKDPGLRNLTSEWGSTHPRVRTIQTRGSMDNWELLTQVTRIVDLRFNTGYSKEFWDPKAIAKERWLRSRP